MPKRGRPQIIEDSVLIATKVPRETRDRVDDLAGKRRRSGWLREAIDEKLEREDPAQPDEP